MFLVHFPNRTFTGDPRPASRKEPLPMTRLEEARRWTCRERINSRLTPSRIFACMIDLPVVDLPGRERSRLDLRTKIREPGEQAMPEAGFRPSWTRGKCCGSADELPLLRGRPC